MLTACGKTCQFLRCVPGPRLLDQGRHWTAAGERNQGASGACAASEALVLPENQHGLLFLSPNLPQEPRPRPLGAQTQRQQPMAPTAASPAHPSLSLAVREQERALEPICARTQVLLRTAAARACRQLEQEVTAAAVCCGLELVPVPPPRSSSSSSKQSLRTAGG